MKATTATEIPIRPYTTKQLSMIYGVSNRIIRRWLSPYAEELGKRRGHFYSRSQIEFILAKLGTPELEC